MKKHKVVVKAMPHQNREWIEVDGKAYALTPTEPHDKPLKAGSVGANQVIERELQEIDLDEYEGRLEALTTQLIPKVDIHQLIKQSLRDVNLQDLGKMEREMKKKEPSVRREKGCVRVRIGGIPLVLRN